jgi:hypothetical protein
MTATTTEQDTTPDLDAVADFLDAAAAKATGDEDAARLATIAANKLDRFGGAVALAAVIDAAQERTGSTSTLSLALKRGPGRESLPAVAHVPFRTNKAGDWTTGTVNVHASDTVVAAVASIAGAVAMVTDPPVVDSWAKSASGRTPLVDTFGRRTDKDLLASVKLTDDKGRTPWSFSAVVHSTGTRGRSASACI